MDTPRFRTLGGLAVREGGAEHAPRGPKLGALLALLVLRPGRTVGMDALVDELWGDHPPRGAVATVRTHVYHLRRALREDLGEGADRFLVTRPPGYAADIVPEEVDATRFTRAAERARLLLAEGRADRAYTEAGAGLELWRGRPLADVRTGRALSGVAQRLEEVRLQLLTVRIEARMLQGRYTELLPELRDLVAAHPLNEPFHAFLIEALHRSGRRGDALGAFHRLSSVLDEELGLEPSERARRLRQVILTDPVPGRAGTVDPAGAVGTAETVGAVGAAGAR
ncbi:AfsR/SARP family transcriptional regulator [Nocardiopsis sp. RSe5-2]|uniref:AfsR/SARP family transcriptional regulator n=1 Tax=Nocardiopsis endophytica TaxID=3018445 RepID=A0ABT4TXH2_9ACTN|nr:AfsR/SARP family transcriptional regulator [Nocardiopsis endophytica]MDA2809377.1 AfsR/SARP family transcriptional regulator [Nocardiopsis endophytica]